jgi:hypothetical protein
MKPDPMIHKLRQRLEVVSRENQRFRERLELMASQNFHLRERVKSTAGSPPEVVSFEEIPPLEGKRSEVAIEPRWKSTCRHTGWYFSDWFPAFQNGIAPLNPAPGARCLTAHRAPIRIGFRFFGLDVEALETHVKAVEERQLRERDFIPVFVTDCSDFSIFRRRGYVFEYIPPMIANAPAGKRGLRRILNDRLTLIKAKWNLSDIVDLTG